MTFRTSNKDLADPKSIFNSDPIFSWEVNVSDFPPPPPPPPITLKILKHSDRPSISPTPWIVGHGGPRKAAVLKLRISQKGNSSNLPLPLVSGIG